MRAELEAGKPRAQALAIAYSVKKAAGHYAGGTIDMKHSLHAHLVKMARRKMGSKPMPEEDDMAMAEGGMVEDQEDEEDMLAMHDTYPTSDYEESDRMGEEMEGSALDHPLDNEEGDEDQEEARRQVLRQRARKLIR